MSAQCFPFQNILVREVKESHSELSLVIQLYFPFCYCICHSSFSLFIRKVCCVFVCTLVSGPASGWSFEFCTFTNKLRITSPFDNFLSSSVYTVVCSLFPDALLPESFGVALHSGHHHLFYHLSVVNLSEKVNEVVHSMLPLVFGSRLNVHQSPNKHWPFVAWRMQSPLSDLFGIFFAFSFCFTFARRSSCRSVLVSFFSL